MTTPLGDALEKIADEMMDEAQQAERRVARCNWCHNLTGIDRLEFIPVTSEGECDNFGEDPVGPVTKVALLCPLCLDCPQY